MSGKLTDSNYSQNAEITAFSSETTPFHFNKVCQPQVKKILQARAIWIVLFSIVIAVVLTVILSVIPSTRIYYDY